MRRGRIHRDVYEPETRDRLADLFIWWAQAKAPPEITPGLAPEGMSQEAWEAYCLDAILRWRKIPFQDENDRHNLAEAKRKARGRFSAPDRYDW